MIKTLGIIAAGDLGIQIAHYAITDHHYDKVVFFDDVTNEKFVAGHPVIGKTIDIEEAYRQNKFDELIIALGYKHLDLKEKIYNDFVGKIPFGKIIHTTTWVDPSAIIEEGCVIYPSCSIDAKVHIQANTVLNIACTIAHDTEIGKHSFLSPRVALAGFIKVSNKCILGINSTVIDNIFIQEGTQLGGGTVVIKSLNQKGLYVGNPARFVR